LIKKILRLNKIKIFYRAITIMNQNQKTKKVVKFLLRVSLNSNKQLKTNQIKTKRSY
jgi:hypothetical protein